MIKPKAKKPQKEIGVKEVVDEEKRELQLSTISQHLSEKSEVKPRISKSDEPMVRAKTTIKMTPSSQKSMVAQSLEKETENKSEVQKTPSSQKSMVAQFSEKGTDKGSKVQDTVRSGSETLHTGTTIPMTPSSRKSMDAQFLEKETETYYQDTGKSFSEVLILASTNPQYDKIGIVH